MRRLVTVWDAPTRVFHWGLALSVIACWITADRGGEGAHRFFGFVAASLLIFRVAWGVIGSETARFAQFLDRPSRVLAFLKGAPAGRWGHDPLAGWAVAALMAAAGWAVISGLLVGDPEANPAAAAAHARSWTILGLLIVAHVAAVLLLDALRGTGLLGAMIGGARTDTGDGPPAPAIAPSRLALRVGAVSALAAAALFGFRIA